MSRTPISSAPRGAKVSGRSLWRAVLTDYELSEHELTLLRQAVAVADLCDGLQAAVDAEGLIVQGRPHPALVESQQRILLGRLIVALRVPMGDEDEQRGQHRGTRGVYGIRGAIS